MCQKNELFPPRPIVQRMGKWITLRNISDDADGTGREYTSRAVRKRSRVIYIYIT